MPEPTQEGPASPWTPLASAAAGMTPVHPAGNGLAEAMRSIVRPILTLGGFGVALYLLIQGTEVAQWLLTLNTLNIGWWFAERALTKGRNGQ